VSDFAVQASLGVTRLDRDNRSRYTNHRVTGPPLAPPGLEFARRRLRAKILPAYLPTRAERGACQRAPGH